MDYGIEPISGLLRRINLYSHRYSRDLLLLKVYQKSTIPPTERALARICAAIFMLILFLDATPISWRIWNWLLPLQLIQFSWRFYSHLLLITCVFLAVTHSAR